jgi:hypothetical protein
MKVKEGDVLTCGAKDCEVELTVTKACAGKTCGTECEVDAKCHGKPMKVKRK